MARNVFTLFWALAGLLIGGPAALADTVPGNACTAGELNAIRHVGGPTLSGVSHILHCDGAAWDSLTSITPVDGTFSPKFELIAGNTDAVPMMQLRAPGFNSSMSQDYGGLTDVMFRISSPSTAGNIWTGKMIMEGLAYSGAGLMVRGIQRTSGSVTVPPLLLTAQKWNGASASASLTGTDVILGVSPDSGTTTTALFLANGQFTTAGNIGVANASPNVALDVTGDIEYTGTIFDVSDGRLKTDIRALPPQLERITGLQGVSFVMKDDPKRRTEIGLIAQKVAPLYPDLVSDSGSGVMSLNYVGLIAPMIEAIKEQQVQIQQQQAQIEDLRQQSAKLAHEIEILKGTMRPPHAPYNQ